MLKQIRFKNWRNLRDVTIDLAPITVFIGANSSGKTNIVQGLKFRHDMRKRGLVEHVSDLGYREIQSLAPIGDETVELEVTFTIHGSEFIETNFLKFDGRNFPFQFGRSLKEGSNVLEYLRFTEMPSKADMRAKPLDRNMESGERARDFRLFAERAYQYRWQFLGENFLPPMKLAGSESGDRYVLEADARNTLLILELMQDGFPDVYDDLVVDASWLLPHIRQMKISRQLESRDLKLVVAEESGRSAPTVSTGSRRLFSMLAAMYALDMVREAAAIPEISSSHPISAYTISPSDPGLVIIEEPDNALNPGVMRNFVEILRRFTSDPDKPRQVILTTHNPTFLNLFEPEEVRVVERGEDGYSTVNEVPEHIRDIWLKDGEYRLGDVWLTNSFGGVAW